MTDANAETGADVQAETAPVAATAKRAKRGLPESTRRLLLIVAGVFVLAGSILGFYLVSDVFEERYPVLVAARDIEAGEILSSADFTFDYALVGSVPHVHWTPEAPFAFEGMAAAEAITAGELVRYDMVIVPDAAAVGVEMEVVVPLDLALAVDEVSEGELVLLVDPGVEPVPGDEGRPRQVVREFVLTNFDGSQMRLYLEPEEWAEWEVYLEHIGGAFMVVDLGIGADPAETAQRLDAVWLEQWTEAVAELELALAEAVPAAGPGELEVIVSLDDGLVPSGVADGDLVLLVDPGAEPLGNDPGRPRSVIDVLRLENYEGGLMQMFVEPEEWFYWRTLPALIGGDPLVLPVPEGTDVDDMSARLNAQWQAAWEAFAAVARGAS